MKKTAGCLAAVVLAASLNCFAGWMETQAEFWAEAAAKEFKLTPEQKQAVYDATIRRAGRLVEVNALKDAGDEQGAQEKLKASGTLYIDDIKKIVGAENPGPIWEFDKRTRTAYKEKLQEEK